MCSIIFSRLILWPTNDMVDANASQVFSLTNSIWRHRAKESCHDVDPGRSSLAAFQTLLFFGGVLATAVSFK